MKRLKEFVVLLCVAFGLCGCIKQDLDVKLNADGSGVIVLKRQISDHEQMLKFIEEDPSKLPKFKYLSLSEKVEKRDGMDWRISTYNFKKLGEALPELEHEIPMIPRFTVRGDKFVMFLNRERGNNEGFRIEDKEFDELFYNLSVTFPSRATSAKGKVSGKTVSWKFNAGNLKNFKSLNIGEPILKAEIAASSISADIKPRQVGEPVRKLGNGTGGLTGGMNFAKASAEPLISFDAKIPIFGEHHKSKDGLNGTITVNFSVDSLPVPFSYKELKLTSLVIDGKKIKSSIYGSTYGVYTGTDKWGRKLTAFPVKIRFDAQDVWAKKIDELAISLKVEEATKTMKHFIAVSKESISTVQTFADKKKLIVTKVAHGSSTAAYPAASISLISDCEPTTILGVHLDSDHGLRFAMNVLKWEKKKINQIWDKDTKAGATKLVGKDGFVYVASLGLDNIPPPPFDLMIEVIEEKLSVEKNFKLEAINVSK